MQRVLRAIVLGAAVAPAVTPAAADESEITTGRAFVEANCAICHALGAEGASPHAEAPPFRTLSARYPVAALGEALAEGIRVGHPDMPEFVVPPEAIAGVIAYLESIQAQ